MKKEIKTSIEGLEVGMFVSRLDQPWINPPSLLDGMLLESSADIDELRKYCTHVYVDVEQGASPHPRFWILKNIPRSKISSQENISQQVSEKVEANEYAILRKQNYQDTVRFEEEIANAKSAYEKTGDHFKAILTDLKNGKKLDMEAVQEGIADMVDSIIKNPSAMMWIAQLKKSDKYTYGRSLGTSVWCATFGRHLGLEKETIENLSLGGLLLDIGKAMLPETLLKKNGSLSESEKEEMNTHVDRGIKILVQASSSSKDKKISIDVLQMVASHHERADASGYPHGITNAEIPLAGRIAGIIDSYDAMTTDRPYLEKRAMSPHVAITELYQLRGTVFQPELVEQFIQAVGLYPTGSLVELSTGEVGAVIAINGLRRLRPSVMLLLDANKQPLQTFRHINLSQMDESIKVAKGLPVGAYGINMDELFL